jgi:DNA-binding NtrC family response regulator
VDVLIVDDNEMNARALQRALKNRHQVRIATTSAAALAEVVSRCPDVIVCDFELADETCAGFLRAVTSDHPGVRRILYSASRPELWSELVDEKLIDGSIAKPATTESIIEAIERKG